MIDRREDDGRAWKCTLCYDRLKEDMEPACAKACPTDSIKFGDLEELQQTARARVDRLHENGMEEAYLYGADAAGQPGTEGLNAFFLLVDKPEAYNLPPDPVVPTKNGRRSLEVVRVRRAGAARGRGRLRDGFAGKQTAMSTTTTACAIRSASIPSRPTAATSTRRSRA